MGKHLRALGATLRRGARRRWMRFIPKGICYNNAGPAMGCSIPALRTVSHQFGRGLRRRNDGGKASVRNLTAAQIDFVLMWHVTTLIHGIIRMSPAGYSFRQSVPAHFSIGTNLYTVSILMDRRETFRLQAAESGRRQAHHGHDIYLRLVEERLRRLRKRRNHLA